MAELTVAMSCPLKRARWTFYLTAAQAALPSVTPALNRLVKCKMVNRLPSLAVRPCWRRGYIIGRLGHSIEHHIQIRCELLRWKGNHVTDCVGLTRQICSLFTLPPLNSLHSGHCQSMLLRETCQWQTNDPGHSQKSWWACSEHKTHQQPYGNHRGGVVGHISV